MIKSTLAKVNYNTARNKYFHALKKQKQEFFTILFKQQQNNMKQIGTQSILFLETFEQKLALYLK